MSRLKLVLRTLWFFRAADAAVLAGVALGTAVLAGSLLVGDSVTGSLREYARRRLGGVAFVVVAQHPFRAALAEFARPPAGPEYSEPILFTAGGCERQDTGRAVANVSIYGREGIAPGTCVVSARLADDLGLSAGRTLVLRLARVGAASEDTALGFQKRDAIPLGLRVARIARDDEMEGAFAFYPSQRSPRNAWVPLADLQRAMKLPGRANAMFVSPMAPARPGASSGSGPGAAERLGDMIRSRITLEDYGLETRTGADGAVVLDSDRVFLPKAVMDALDDAPGQRRAVSAYLANTLSDARTGRSCPYTMVAGMAAPPGGPIADGEIVLSRWAADDLEAGPGDGIRIEYYVRGEGGLLETRKAELRLARVVPTEGLGADPTLVPEFPGLTDARTLSAWDPPREFRFDLKRIRPIDERYWDQHRAAPRAFVSLGTAERLWASPDGWVTSVRITGATGEQVSASLLRSLTPSAMGIVVRPIAEEQLQAAGGTTDFGQLFIGFSFFIIVSAALLVVLLMRLAVEQRRRQIALLAAVGFTAGAVRRLLLAEGLLVLLAGAVVGIGVSVGYAWLMLAGLRTIWNAAVGTAFLGLHVTAGSVGAGFAAGVGVGAFSIWRGVGSLRGLEIAGLILGRERMRGPAGRGRRLWPVAGAAMVAGAAAVTVVSLAAGRIDAAGAFFGAGALLLGGALVLEGCALGRVGRGRSDRLARGGLGPLALRNACRNLSRSMLTIGLIASATFIVVSVNALRANVAAGDTGKRGGTGGLRLIAETDSPIPYDLNQPRGRELLGISSGDDALWERVHFYGLRVSTGSDLSCRNLYRAVNPRVMGVPDALIERGGWTFAATSRRVANPWSLLRETLPGGEVPAIADLDTAQWILHVGVGDTVGVTDASGRRRVLRIVGLLKKSIFQGELLVGDRSFSELFPEKRLGRTVLVDCPADDAPRVEQALRSGLGDYGLTVETTARRLASFAEIANSYISAFTALGGLGLLMGSFGVLIVLVRGVIERRAELALLGAVGFRPRRIEHLLLLENGGLLVAGMLTGTLCALLAVVPQGLRGYDVDSLVVVTQGLMPSIMILVLVTLALAARGAVRRVTLAALRIE